MDLSEFKTRDEKTQYLKLSLGGVSSSISKRSNFLRSSLSACNAAPSNGKFMAIEEAIKRLMDAKEKAHARYDALAELCPNDSESYEDKSIEISEKIGVLIDEADRAIVQGKEALTKTILVNQARRTSSPDLEKLRKKLNLISFTPTQDDGVHFLERLLPELLPRSAHPPSLHGNTK
ncbi:Hypothetical protein FKW44_007535, partial [Caligus rogercresseyi]